MEWTKTETEWSKDLSQLEEKYYLSNEITQQDVLDLIEIHKEKRVMVSLNTPMGTGKTQFLLKNLIPMAKQENMKVLIITGRKLLREQIKQDYFTENPKEKHYSRHIVDIECYQKIGNMLQSQQGYEELKDKYDIIVVDEAHQLMLDSLFSFDNELVVEFLTELSNAMIWLVTATDDVVEPFVFKYTGFKVKVTGKIDFSMLDSVIIGSQRQIVQQLEEEVTPTTKVFSINSKLLTTNKNGETGEPTELVKFLLDKAYDDDYSVGTLVGDNFLNSHKDDKIQKYVELIKNLQESLEKPIVNKLMQCRILVTSEVARDGIEILDEQVDIIITDFICYDELMQSINRVRKLAKVKLYIICQNKVSLNGKLSSLKNKYKVALPMYDEWNMSGTHELLDDYIDKKGRTTRLANGLYRTSNGEIKLRKAQMAKVFYTIDTLEIILNDYSQYGFYMCHSQYIKMLLTDYCNVDSSKIVALVEQVEQDQKQQRADEVEKFISGNMLSNNEYFITSKDEKIQLAMLVGAVNRDGKATFTPKAVNKALVNLDLNYTVIQTQRKVKGTNKKGWLIQRIVPRKETDENDID